MAGAQSGTSSTGTTGKPNPQQARSATRLDMYPIQGLEWGSTCIVCYEHDVPGVKPHARHIHPCREQPPPIVADIQHIPAGSCRSAQPEALLPKCVQPQPTCLGIEVMISEILLPACWNTVVACLQFRAEARTRLWQAVACALRAKFKVKPRFQAGSASCVAFVGRSHSSLLLYMMRCQGDQLIRNA